MKIKHIVSVIVLIFLLHTTLWADSHWNLSLNSDQQDEGKYDQKKQEKKLREEYKRDVMIGYLMAIGPGFIVHGAGNFYAGNSKRGAVMCIAGVVGTLGIFLYEISKGLSENHGELSTRGKIVLAGSITLFFGSWLWDIATVEDSIRDRYPPSVKLSIAPLRINNRYDNHAVWGLNLSINF